MNNTVIMTKTSVHQHAQNLLDFIDNSPSPWHVVAAFEAQLKTQGFVRLYETELWQLQPAGRYYVVRDQSSIIIFKLGSKLLAETGFRIVGAHTDSPGLQVKPRAAQAKGNMIRLGVEVYGSPILATFSDRDLSLAGRVSMRTTDGSIETRLLRYDEALLRLPNLAIHMNRKVNENGLQFNQQTELPLLAGMLEENLSAQDWFLSGLADKLACQPDAVLSWELNVYDTQKGAFYGSQAEYFANSQLDNLTSCHAALTALLAASESESEVTSVCAFFDHEEIGSDSAKGANSSFLSDILERVSLAQTSDREAHKRALAHSFLISADMAHAYQPNFPSAYEPDHPVRVNAGPVIKVNANHRYTSEAVSEAQFMMLCEQANVPWQTYVHRTDSPCGSTIGPMVSAQLGIRTIDVGCPVWAMHSIRESAGVMDHSYMTQVLQCFFTTDRLKN